MKVKLLTNLGTREADELQLSHDKCSCGDELEVSTVVGEILVKRNRVLVLEHPPIKAVPVKPALAQTKPAKVKNRKPASKTAEKQNLSTDSKEP